MLPSYGPFLILQLLDSPSLWHSWSAHLKWCPGLAFRLLIFLTRLFFLRLLKSTVDVGLPGFHLQLYSFLPFNVLLQITSYIVMCSNNKCESPNAFYLYHPSEVPKRFQLTLGLPVTVHLKYIMAGTTFKFLPTPTVCSRLSLLTTTYSKLETEFLWLVCLTDGISEIFWPLILFMLIDDYNWVPYLCSLPPPVYPFLWQEFSV